VAFFPSIFALLFLLPYELPNFGNNLQKEFEELSGEREFDFKIESCFAAF
jgi:hypothetical protein